MQHVNLVGSLVLSCVLILGAFGSSMSVAQEPELEFKQVKLTEDLVKNLIAAQPELAAVAKKLEALPDDAPVNVQDDLDAIATKHGFKNFVELDEISANVQLVLDGLDPETGEYTDPVVGLKEELEQVKADTEMPAEEKSTLIAELEDALTALPALEHKANIELVKKYSAEIQKSLDQSDGGN